MAPRRIVGASAVVFGLGILVALGFHEREPVPEPARPRPPPPQSARLAPSPPSASVGIGRLSDLRARACPRKRSRPLRLADLPALNEKPSLSRLLTAGANGDPQRVRLRFHHPIAGCECPSFGLSDDDDDGDTFEGLALLSWTYVVFPDEVPNGHEFENGKYYGSTKYELTGYFSGRVIDFYDWAEAQNGEPRGAPIGDEQESDRESRYPEFCVEDWCYRPDPDPPLYKEGSPSEIAEARTEYQRVVARMARAGAKRCVK